MGNIGVKKDGFLLLIVHLNVRCRHVSVNTRTSVVTVVVVIDEIKLKRFNESFRGGPVEIVLLLSSCPGPGLLLEPRKHDTEALQSVGQDEDCIDVAPDARHYMEPHNHDRWGRVEIRDSQDSEGQGACFKSYKIAFVLRNAPADIISIESRTLLKVERRYTICISV